tara:strand:+ start:124 stop:378 length:255 start_codon:yes stop_codon:yes gene_type:complete
MVSYSNTANPVNISLAGGLIGLGGLMWISQKAGNMDFYGQPYDALVSLMTLGMAPRDGEALPITVLLAGIGAALAQGTRTSYAL